MFKNIKKEDRPYWHLPLLKTADFWLGVVAGAAGLYLGYLVFHLF